MFNVYIYRRDEIGEKRTNISYLGNFRKYSAPAIIDKTILRNCSNPGICYIYYYVFNCSLLFKKYHELLGNAVGKGGNNLSDINIGKSEL